MRCLCFILLFLSQNLYSQNISLESVTADRIPEDVVLPSIEKYSLYELDQKEVFDLLQNSKSSSISLSADDFEYPLQLEETHLLGPDFEVKLRSSSGEKIHSNIPNFKTYQVTTAKDQALKMPFYISENKLDLTLDTKTGFKRLETVQSSERSNGKSLVMDPLLNTNLPPIIFSTLKSIVLTMTLVTREGFMGKSNLA